MYRSLMLQLIMLYVTQTTIAKPQVARSIDANIVLRPPHIYPYSNMQRSKSSLTNAFFHASSMAGLWVLGRKKMANLVNCSSSLSLNQRWMRLCSGVWGDFAASRTKYWRLQVLLVWMIGLQAQLSVVRVAVLAPEKYLVQA